MAHRRSIATHPGSGTTHHARGAAFALAVIVLAATACAGEVEMVLVPEGPFMMGCNPERRDCWEKHLPFHEVTLSAFEIDLTEVTWGAYRRCVRDGVCGELEPGADGPRYPVLVSWGNAHAYCTWRGKRLPTEAEWEKAARGTDGRDYPWGNEPPDETLAMCYQCGHPIVSGPWRVGSRPAGASPYGALDMAGNVEEWVADWYDAGYYQIAPLVDPPGPDSSTCAPDLGTCRIVRGGGGSGPLTTYYRGQARPTPLTPGNGAGFRCVRSLP